MSFIVRAHADTSDTSAQTDSTFGPESLVLQGDDTWEETDKSHLSNFSLFPPPQVQLHHQSDDRTNWVEVQNLAPSTTGMMLMALFYPHGADEARTVRVNGQLIGLVRFRCCEMAVRASEKMNAFFPFGQNQALRVTPVTPEDVKASLNLSKLQPVSTIFAALSEEAMPAARVAMIIESLPSLQAAREFSEEVLNADQVILSRITDTLMSMNPQWPALRDFGAEVLQRLHLSLIEANCSFQSTSCGVVIANLYLHGIVLGDPFRFASNFLQRAGLRVPHVEGICMLAHVCSSMEYKVSKAGFWAVVREIACNSDDVAISKALLNHLQRYLRHCSHQDIFPTPSRQLVASCKPAISNSSLRRGDAPFSLPSAASVEPFSTNCETPPPASSTFSTNALSKSSVITQDDARLRTVYISHLPPNLPQNMFMALLSRCGPVNKVRICAGKGYATLFSFVEMGTIAGAQGVIKLSGFNCFGCSIRVQTAKNPIQDDLKEDAEISPSGSVNQQCLFGLSSASLTNAVSATDSK